MKKILLLSITFLAVLSLSACNDNKNEIDLQKQNDNKNETELTGKPNDCQSICSIAITKCETLSKEECFNKCENGTKTQIACLQNFQTCQELANDCKIPSMNEATKKPINNCDKACNNYVDKCMSLVPGSTQVVNADAYTSCIDLCQDWKTEKVNCMIDAPRCEDFVEKCGL